MDKLYEQSETGCCPRFDPGPWEDKEIKFKDKLFLKDHVRSFLHIPLNFDKIMVKNMEKISGTFLSKVFEGPCKNMGKWAKEMQGFVKSKGKELKKIIFSIPHVRNARIWKNRTIILAHV